MISHLAAIVPASDEQDEIGGCLAALLRARERLVERSPDTTARIVVVLDGCNDATATVVERFDGVQAVTTSARCVGTARALGVTHALNLAPGVGGDDLWIASTDADSRVPPDWLVAMTAHADRGEDIVVGTVRPFGLSPLISTRWHSAHPPRPDHPYIHGANLGIRASAYARLGGWRDLHSHEDVDLVERAVAHGARIHRSVDLPVITSGRLSGRAPHGFAGYLAALATLTARTEEAS